MMLTQAILLGVTALVNIAVGAAPGGDPSHPLNGTRYPEVPPHALINLLLIRRS